VYLTIPILNITHDLKSPISLAPVGFVADQSALNGWLIWFGANATPDPGGAADDHRRGPVQLRDASPSRG
jgi:hypothetical protein